MSSPEVNAMPLKEWRAYVTSLVRGVRKNLCVSAPRRVRNRLDDFEAQARTLAGMRARTKWADDFDAFVEGTPCVHAAAGRVLAPQFKKVIRNANRLQQQFKQLQKAIQTRAGREGGLESHPSASGAKSRRIWAELAAETEKSAEILDSGRQVMKVLKKR